MKRFKLLKTASGFTLIETTIVLGIIGLITVLLVAGSGDSLKTERFRSEVAIFASTIRSAQTRSYTVMTGDNSAACRVSVAPYNPGSKGCVWRGVVMDFQANTNYTQSLLYGYDFSAFGNLTSNVNSPCIPTDPRDCLLDKLYTDPNIGHLSTSGLVMESIKIDDTPAFSPGTTVGGNLSLAFLAPSGQAYSNCQSGTCSGALGVDVRPYDDKVHLIRFTFRDDAVKLKADVTFDTASGTIKTDIK